MYLKYGPYTHANNEVAYTITSQARKTQAGTYYANLVRWNCRGALLNLPNQGAISAAIDGLIAAYSTDGYDLVHYLDDGVTPTAHSLISANCIGGTRVVEAPSFPDNGGEYQVGYGRSYTFAIEGEVALTGSDVVTSFEESLDFEGTGGPVVVWIPVAQGPWVQQTTSQQSTYRAVQKGQAVALYNSASPPPPIWPENEIQQQRKISYGSAKRYGLYDWPVSWSYTFESSGGLNGQPNSPPS